MSERDTDWTTGTEIEIEDTEPTRELTEVEAYIARVTWLVWDGTEA